MTIRFPPKDQTTNQAFAPERLRLGRDVRALRRGGRRQVNVTAFHYDNLRSGWNSKETVLSQSNLASSNFGLQRRDITVDAKVQTQPLFVSNETIAGSQHDVVSENNSVCAIDAYSGDVLIETNLGPAMPGLQVAGCHHASPHMGIDLTPVIDLSSGTLHAIACTWEISMPNHDSSLRATDCTLARLRV